MGQKEKETKVLSFANLKGGIGKTTMTMAVGVTMAMEFGKKVLLIDCDKQRSITKFGVLKDPVEEPPFVVDIKTAVFSDSRSETAIRKWLDELESIITEAIGKYDCVFIDVPGYIDQNLVTIFAYTDLVVIPLVMSEVDILSTKDFIDETMAKVIKLKQMKEIPFKTYFAVNKITNRKNFRQIYEFAEALEIPVFDNGLKMRDKHYDSDLSLKNGLVKGDKSHEVYKLTDEILTALNNIN